MALFVSSNTAVGASVMLSATLLDVPGTAAAAAAAGAAGAGGGPHVPLTLPPLFDFTLANSVRDMWHAGVYPLAGAYTRPLFSST